MKKIILLTAILLSYYNLYSNELILIDSIQQCIEKSNDILLTEEDRIYNAKKAINFAKQLENDTLIIRSILNYANINFNFSKYVETIKILQNAIDSCNFSNDSLHLGIMINLQGVAFGELSQNATAIRYFKKARNIFKQVGYNYGIFETLNNIGLIYYYNEDYERAKKYFLDIIKKYKNIFKENEISSAYLNIGNIYVREKQYKKGEDFYNMIIKNKEIKDQERDLYCLALNGLSKLYITLGDINKAYNTIIKTKNIKNIPPKLKQVISVEIMADILLEMDSINKANNLYTYALRYADKLDLTELKVELLKKQAKIYNQTNKYKKSYKLLNEAIDLMDSLKLLEVVNNSKLQEEFFLYEQEKKNLIKEKNKIQIQKQEAKIKLNKQRMWLIIFIITFISLSILIIIVIKNHKTKIKHIKEANKLKLDYQKEVASKLETEVNYKIEQFTEVALILSNQNIFLKDIKDNLDKIKNKDYSQITDIKVRLANIIKVNEEKEIFYNAIENVNKQIINDLKEKYPIITDNDIRLICLSKLNMSNKDVSNLIGTSVRNIEMARYRLKKKLNLGKDENIEDLINV